MLLLEEINNQVISFKEKLTNHFEENDFDIELYNSEIDVFSKKIIDILSESILNGWYIGSPSVLKDIQDIEHTFNELNSFIVNILSTIEEFDLKILTYLLKDILDSVAKYERLVENIEDKFKFHSKRVYINESLKSYFTKYDFFENRRSEIHLVFMCNLFVAYCDHFMSHYDNQLINKFDEVIQKIENADLRRKHSWINKLILKAKYLRSKLLFRRIEENKSVDPTVEIYVPSLGKNKRLNPTDFSKEDYLRPFLKWVDYSLIHYEISDKWDKELSSGIEVTTDYDGLSLLELHRIIKYAKDIAQNRKLIIDVRKTIIKKLRNNQLPTFDKYALQVCLGYCYNNEFSLICQQSKSLDNNEKVYPYEEVKALYNEIMDSEFLIKVKNYFVPALMLSRNVHELSKIFEKQEVFQNIDKCANLIQDSENIKKLYFERIAWVKSNYNYIFQLPNDECKVHLNEEGSQIFIFSSFLLPISRDFLDKRFKVDLDELRVYKASIENLNITKEGIDKINLLTKEFDDAKKDFVKSETKTLELVAIVATIMTFVSASITGFKFIDTGIEAIMFTLSLGSSLALFALVFYAINRGHEKLKSLKFPLIIGFIAIVILWFLFYFFTLESNLQLNSILLVLICPFIA